MDKIALLYSPAKGNTERVARLIQNKIGQAKLDLILVDETTQPTCLNSYVKVIFGISTVGRDSWDSKYTKVGWDTFLPKLEKADLKGKTVAIFGLGDQLLYTNNFVDAIGTLGNLLIKCGAKLVGKTAVEGYEFKESAAISDGMFIGLPIDEDREPELTEQRVSDWIIKISKEFGIV